ncbi:MAG: hypothetical protein J6C90_03475 [Clostridia bacterium]|nr:hypothetical protein [Clostridia bacterium]
MSDFNWKKVVNLLAYIALIAVAVALILVKIFNGSQVASALNVIANSVAYIITAISAFAFARSKRNPWVMIFFVVAVILVVVFMILN